MSYPVLARRDTALDDAETTALLRDRLGDGIVGDVAEYGELTVEVAAAAWHDTVALCRDEDLLSFDLFDCLFGVDAGEEGLDVVAILYSTSKGRRIMLRTRCDGGREAPVVASVADIYVGANWHERETFDMFGIDFEGHPGLLPRILCIENFEGWPLRKEFPLASRVAKPWPGVKDPAEPDEDGNVVVREPAIGEAPGPSGLDEIIAKQAREANPTAASEIDADQSSSGGADAANAASEEPERQEVELDQEVYDRLIGEGKSERIARSKAKAAFIKKQRAAAAAADAADADDDGEQDTDVAATSTDEAEAPASPDAEAGAGTEGATVEEAAPPPSIPDDPDQPTDDVDTVDEPADADAPGDDTSGSGDDTPAAATVEEDAAATAAARADAARAEQAAAREAKAVESADESAHADEGLTPVPAGSPPPDPGPDPEPDPEPDAEDAEDAAVAASVDAEDPADDTTDPDGDDETSEPEVADATTDDPEPDAEDSADVEAARSQDDSTAGVDDTDDAGDAVDDTDEVPDDAATDDATTDDAATDDAPVAEGPEVDEPGPFGPGSAYPREDGSGPDGWRIKATQDGNVFHTQDSPNWRQAEADVWFDDVATARAAGFEHWDPYLRTDLEAEPVTSTTDDGPAPVGGTLPGDGGVDEPDPAADVDLHVDEPGEGGPPGYGALDVHEHGAEVEVAAGSDDTEDGPYGAGSAAPAEDGSGPDGFEVKGNGDSMLFHTPDSPQYDRTTAKVWFFSVEAARAAGFAHWDRDQRLDQPDDEPTDDPAEEGHDA